MLDMCVIIVYNKCMDNRNRYNYNNRGRANAPRPSYGSNLPEVNCPNPYTSSVVRQPYTNAPSAAAAYAYKSYGRTEVKDKSFFRSFAFVLCAVIIGMLLLLTVVFVSFRGGSTTTIDRNLSAPQNLTLNNHTLAWDSVPNATGYAIYVNGRRMTVVDSASVDLSAFLSGFGQFEVTVRAVGGDAFVDSAPATATFRR